MSSVNNLLPKDATDMGEIRLYMDDGTTRAYTPSNICFKLDSSTGVAVACNNTPKNLHALTMNMQQEMFLVLEHARRCEDVKVLVWTASGEKSFSSGASIGRRLLTSYLVPMRPHAY